MKNTTKAYLQRKIDEELKNIDKRINQAEKEIELLQALTTRTKKDGGQFANFSQNFENKFIRKLDFTPRYNFSNQFIGYSLILSSSELCCREHQFISVDLYIDCKENDVQAVLAERDRTINSYNRLITRLHYEKDNIQRIFDELVVPFIDAIENEEEKGYRYLKLVIRDWL